MNPQAILDAREKRAEYQNWLITTHGQPLLVLRVNYPGILKDTPVSRGIFREMEQQITEELQAETVFRRVTVTAEGPLMTMSVRKDASELKKFALAMEINHPLGRYIDLDVIGTDGKSLDRRSFGMEPRACYLCTEPAHACARSRKHTFDELTTHIDRQYLKYLESRPYETAQHAFFAHHSNHTNHVQHI